MSNPHEVYIQIEDANAPHPVHAHDEDTIVVVLERLCAQRSHPNHRPELIALFAVFADDAEEEISKDAKFAECHPHRPKLLHCHRCREIEVTVFYNGEESHAFRPNTRIRHILKWAEDKFTVDKGRKWVLRSGSAEGDILGSDTHIGTLVKFPDCRISLYLTERCLILG